MKFACVLLLALAAGCGIQNPSTRGSGGSKSQEESPENPLPGAFDGADTDADTETGASNDSGDAGQGADASGDDAADTGDDAGSDAESDVIEPADGDANDAPDETDDAPAPCDVHYYNSDFAYGFNLPRNVTLTRFDDNAVALFNAGWSDNVADARYVTTVFEWQGTLTEWIDELNGLSRDQGAEFLTETDLFLPNGDEAFLSIYILDGVINYRMDVQKHDRIYNAWTFEADTDADSATIAAPPEVLSLCVD